jgi:integrase
VEVDGIKCVALLPDAGTIKTGRFRNVPLHPDLLDQGVWEFAQTSAPGPLFYDASLTSSRPWENTTAFLSEWVRKDVGVTDPAVKPGHGWRHWFVAKAHTAGLSDGAIEAICGHAPASEGRKYGGWEVAALLREVTKLPRFVLP